MMNLYIKKISLFIVLMLPLYASAATVKDIVKSVLDVSSAIIPLLFSAALAMFIWGIVEFIRSANNPEERKKGKQRIMWGILALTAMVGYLGLTSFFTQTFFDKDAKIIPQFFEK